MELVSIGRLPGSCDFVALSAKEVYVRVNRKIYGTGFPVPCLLQHNQPDNAASFRHLVKEDDEFFVKFTSRGTLKAIWAMVRATQQLPIDVFDTVEKFLYRPSDLILDGGDFKYKIRVQQLLPSFQFSVMPNGIKRLKKKNWTVLRMSLSIESMHAKKKVSVD